MGPRQVRRKSASQKFCKHSLDSRVGALTARSETSSLVSARWEADTHDPMVFRWNATARKGLGNRLHCPRAAPFGCQRERPFGQYVNHLERVWQEFGDSVGS